MAALFEVDDGFELNALLRALFAAKFRAPADGLELPGSPILARLCERAMASMVVAQEAGRFPGNPDQTRAAYRTLAPTAEVVVSVRGHVSVVAVRGGNWAQWSPAERADYVRLVFRPYVAEESLVRELAGSAPDAEPLSWTPDSRQ